MLPRVLPPEAEATWFRVTRKSIRVQPLPPKGGSHVDFFPPQGGRHAASFHTKDNPCFSVFIRGPLLSVAAVASYESLSVFFRVFPCLSVALLSVASIST